MPLQRTCSWSVTLNSTLTLHYITLPPLPPAPPPSSLQVLFGLPLGLGSSTSYSIHFFTQPSSFRNTCPYHHSLFCCNTNAMSSITNLSLSSLLENLLFYLNTTHLPDHSHLCSLKCHLIFFPYRPGLTSMQHTALHTTTVQPSSHNQRHVLIGKQWYQLVEFIPANLNSSLHSCISK